MRGLCCIVTIFFAFAGSLSAQSTNDFRSMQTGNWDVLSTWQRFNGTSWVAATAFPTLASGVITIRTGHVVTIPNGLIVTADQLVVNEDLIIAAGGQLILSNGSGTDLSALTAASLVDVSGVLFRNNLSTIDDQATSARMIFRSGSEYRHSYTTTFGDLPAATWDINSTLSIVGFSNPTSSTLTADASWAQSIGNLVYDCPGQAGPVSFNGNLTNVAGDLTLTRTGSNALMLSNGQSITFTVGGNLSVTGTSRLIFSTSGTLTANINGDWTQTSTHTTGSFTTYTGTATVNVAGDFTMNGGVNGKLRLANTGSTGNTTINFGGNFSLLSGRMDENGSGSARGTLRFVNGIQDFTSNGTITGVMNYYVGPTTTLNIIGESALSSVSPGTFTLDGGTISVGSTHALGAIQISSTSGNIRTTGRIYNAGSTVIYNGAATQYIGNGQPQVAGITTVIDNPNDVLMTAAITNGGVIRLVSGSLHLNNFLLTSTGTLETAGGTLKSTAASSLVIQGSSGGSWGTMSFDPSANEIGSITLNRTGVGAGVTLNSALNIASQLNLYRGDFNNNVGIEFSPGAVVTRYNTATLNGVRPTVTGGTFDVVYRTFSAAGGPYANFGHTQELPNDAASLGSLTVSMAQNADVFVLGQPITINGTFSLGKGIMSVGASNITMRGASWLDNAGVLDGGTGTVIFDGTTVAGGSANPAFNNITLLNGRSLTFSRSFSVAGNFNFASGSTFDMGAYTATFSGATTQTISVNGATFSNVTITKSGGNVQVTTPWRISGVLQFSSTTVACTVQSGGFITLLSTTDAAGTGNASVYRLQNSNTISGNVIVQRYMSGEGMIYRYISVPVSGAMLSQWKDDVDITGPFVDPSPKRKICGVWTDPASYSLYYYDETAAGTANDGYVGYPLPGNSTTTSPIVVGRGYAVYNRQCSLPTILDVTGPINSGIVSLPVTYTSTGSADDGWNLVGNPFPCTIDWDAGTWTKTRISSAISIQDNGTGMVRYYDAGVTNDIPNGQIASGQAFYVRATATTPSLIVRENSKVLNNGEFFRERPMLIPSLALNFSDGTLEDRAYLKVLEGSSDLLDDFDAPKITNPAFSFSVLADDSRKMAIHSINALPELKEFKLWMENVEPGDGYSIGLEIREEFFSDYSFALVDHYLHKEIPIKSGERYDFSVSTDAGSKAEGRFGFKVVKGGSVEEQEALSGINVYPNPVKADFTVELLRDDVMKLEFVNALGQVRSAIEVNGEVRTYSVDFSSYPSGVYLMVVSRKSSKKSIRLYKE